MGHAGTLDPMATGLLIVCIVKPLRWLTGLLSFKFNILMPYVSVYDELQKENIKVLCFCRYQGMIKGYSGVFRLGEATSTLDADSPVLQRLLSSLSWLISYIR